MTYLPWQNQPPANFVEQEIKELHEIGICLYYEQGQLGFRESHIVGRHNAWRDGDMVRGICRRCERLVETPLEPSSGKWLTVRNYVIHESPW